MNIDTERKKEESGNEKKEEEEERETQASTKENKWKRKLSGQT